MGKSAPVQNPVTELRQRLGLTQAQFGELVGRTRACVADIEQMRRPKPPTKFFQLLQRHGLLQDVRRAEAQYRAAFAGLGPEWVPASTTPTPTTLPAINALAPSNPLQQFLDFNSMTPAELKRKLGRPRHIVVDRILARTAPLHAAAEFFDRLRWALPVEWSTSCLSDNAVEMYRIVVDFYRERDSNGWRNWIERSQPNEASE